MIRNTAGEWMDNPQDIALMLQDYFRSIFQPLSGTKLDNQQHGSDIDPVLHELHLSHISDQDQHALLSPITDQEI